MSKQKFPLDSLFTSITAVSELVKEIIPSDELREKEFEENAPIRKMRKLKQLLKKSVRYFRKNGLTVNEVEEFAAQIGQGKAFETLLTKELTK